MPPSQHRSTGGIEIIAARQSDLDLLGRLVHEFYTEAGYALEATRSAVIRGALERLLADGTLGRAWLIRADADGAKHAGYIIVTLGFSIEHGGRDAFVDELYVRRQWRRRGLGRAALARAVRYCRDSGVGALHLEVERTNPAAAALYEHAGFAGNDRRILTLAVGGQGSGTGPVQIG